MDVSQTIIDKYGKETVDKAVDYLSYKRTTELPKNESDSKPVLYVFRHGQTDDNANFLFSGWREASLTDLGKQQAYILAEKLKDKKIHRLISSPQKRAVDTMKIAISLNASAKDIPITLDERIKERKYGDLQGKSKLVAYLEDKDLAMLERRSYKFVPPNGESIEMVCKRVGNFCEDITRIMKNENINVAISCHGNSFRGFRKYFENLDEDTTASVETPLGQDYASYVVE
jgi:broad specificity phosphatase PhoE